MNLTSNHSNIDFQEGKLNHLLDVDDLSLSKIENLIQ